MVRIYGGRMSFEHVPGDIYPRASEVFNGCLMGFNIFLIQFNRLCVPGDFLGRLLDVDDAGGRPGLVNAKLAGVPI